MKTRLLLAPILAIAILCQVACAPNIAMLKGDVDAFAPLVAYEIQQGHIAADEAKLYTDDGKLLIDNFGQLASAWGGNKALALGTFAGQILPIVNDFAKIPHLQEAMLIVQTTVGILRAYYGGTAPQMVPGASAERIPANDAEVNEFLKKQRAKLKAALAH